VPALKVPAKLKFLPIVIASASALITAPELVPAKLPPEILRVPLPSSLSVSVPFTVTLPE